MRTLLFRDAGIDYGISGAGATGGSGFFTAANNGLTPSTVDADTVVLGQDVGESGNPGQLLSNREVPLNGFSIDFLGSDAQVAVDAPGQVFIGGPASAAGLVSNIWEPNNYGTVYAGHGVADRFSSGWQRFDGVNTYPRPNVVAFWGYNTTPGAGPSNAAEAAFAFRYETDFDIDGAGTDFFELHMPEVTLPSGLVERLWSFYISKVSGSTEHQSQVQDFNFNTKNENFTYYDWTCNTSGALPNENRTLEFDFTARGSNAATSLMFSDQDNAFSQGLIQWDRGSWNIELGGSGASTNNRLISITGNLRQTGANVGASFIQTFSHADQPTEFSCQLFADTFANNPSYLFDRRLSNGSSILTDGDNGGEVVWSGDRNMTLAGIANATASGGTEQCYDLYVGGLDTDSAQHTNLIVGRDGNSIFRGSIKTGDPGSGPGVWLLGQFQTGVVALDAAHYIEVNIDGTLRKILIGV
jgi:hypothetical protein